MAGETRGRNRIARVLALMFGVGYLALAAAEVVLSHRLADSLGIDFIGVQNAAHWVLGAILLAAFFGSERAARLVDRIVGFLLLALAIWGLANPGPVGGWFGFPGDIPVVYNILSLVTAVAALVAGFVSGDP